MMSKDIYEWFKLYFPQFVEHVETWFPNGKNSVRVRQTNGQEFIFSYNGQRDWRFETVDSFLKK
jgi:hypothetical protein